MRPVTGTNRPLSPRPLSPVRSRDISEQSAIPASLFSSTGETTTNGNVGNDVGAFTSSSVEASTTSALRLSSKERIAKNPVTGCLILKDDTSEFRSDAEFSQDPQLAYKVLELVVDLGEQELVVDVGRRVNLTSKQAEDIRCYGKSLVAIAEHSKNIQTGMNLEITQEKQVIQSFCANTIMVLCSEIIKDYSTSSGVDINSITKIAMQGIKNASLLLKKIKIMPLFEELIQTIKTTDFKSELATKRRDPELNNKRLPDHVYLVYKACKNALEQISGIDASDDSIPLKGEILFNALETIRSALNKAKNGNDWKKWNRSPETSSFYSKTALKIADF